MINYEVRKISCKEGKEYIIKNHYTHGCHNGPSPCYGLFDNEKLIGVCMFATPCSENVRASVFGSEYKDMVTELHRLHILDCTPKNTESWFISHCFKLLLKDKPNIRAIISFSDETEGHKGTIYQATNFYFIGKTSKATFYMDDKGRLRHPHQCGVNITRERAKEKNWKPVKRLSKNRYLKIIANDRRELKKLQKLCKYDILNKNWCRVCGKEIDKPLKFCTKCEENKESEKEILK